MEDSRKISLCIPTFNRVDMTLQAFENVYEDDRISEIVIVDDASDWGMFTELKEFCELIPKIKLYRNLTNQDCYRNKMTALSYATNDWCILLDSDNVIEKDYLDRLFEIQDWDNSTSYMPSFAAPTFSYEKFEGETISKSNVGLFMGLPLFDTMLNCMNFFINRIEYLNVWEDVENPHTADSIFFNYCWFNFGNKMYVVPNLKYEHKIHDQSHYILNNHKTGSLYKEVEDKLKNMA